MERSRFSRRTALKTGLAGLGAGSIGAALSTPRAAMSRQTDALACDVVVVGAGYAGLSAALRVAEAGHSALLLEARDRVGGRVFNHELADGLVLEAGAQFIGPTQTRMAALVAAYGMETFATPHDGDDIIYVGGERIVGAPPPALDEEFGRLSSLLNEMAREVPVDAPWTAPSAQEWDSITFRTWLESQNASEEVMQMFSGFSDLWGSETRDLSLLYAVFYIAAAGDVDHPGTLGRLLGIPDAAQELRFVIGAQSLAIRMADALGDQLILSAPVREITWSDDGVVVNADGYTVEARFAIVATPPSMAGIIHYEPKLPTQRALLYQRFPMGSLMKIEPVYERPFWRDAGLSGISVGVTGTVRSTFDNTPEAGAPGILLCFVGGDVSRNWEERTPEERRAETLKDLAKLFGDEALDPIDFFEMNWPAEEWSRGGPVAYMSPGVMTDFGKIVREPVGAIHWAGTETATYWTGYMEGAVQSGERAADEVLAKLNGG